MLDASNALSGRPGNKSDTDIATMSLVILTVNTCFGFTDGVHGNRQLPNTAKAHMLYRLRHTAICMRVINRGGKVNIFNLAKNAGFSVDQIDRFYARFLPQSKEMAKSLQSFGE